MARMRYDRLIKGSDDTSLNTSVASRVDRTLKAYEAFNLGAAYRTEKAGKAIIHASRLLLPKDLRGPVILDATAKQEPLWELLGDRVGIADKVEGVRNYRNVRLHGCKGKRPRQTEHDRTCQGAFDPDARQLERPP